MGTEVGEGSLVDGRVNWKDLLPNHWIVQDARVPSVKLAHVMDGFFELVSRGASNANVILDHEDYPDLYPVLVPTELGEALIRAGRLMVSLTQTDTGLNWILFTDEAA